MSHLGGIYIIYETLSLSSGVSEDCYCVLIHKIIIKCKNKTIWAKKKAQQH